MLSSDVTSVSAIYVQGNILSGLLAILPSDLQVILSSGDPIAVSVVAVVRIQYNKTIITV